MLLDFNCRTKKDKNIKKMPTYCKLAYQHFKTCPEQDSNLHTGTGASPSSWCVYQFHHLGVKILTFRAEDETRTRDPDLGKVVLYQLSYFRNFALQKYN